MSSQELKNRLLLKQGEWLHSKINQSKRISLILFRHNKPDECKWTEKTLNELDKPQMYPRLFLSPGEQLQLDTAFLRSVLVQIFLMRRLKQYLNRCLFEIRLDWVTVEHHMRLMPRNSMHSVATDSCNVITEQQFLLMNIYSLVKWKLKWVQFDTQLCIDFLYEKDKKDICANKHEAML